MTWPVSIAFCVLSASLASMAIIVLLRATKPESRVGVEMARNWVEAYDEGKQVGQSMADASLERFESIPRPHSLQDPAQNEPDFSMADSSDVHVGRNYD